MALDARLPALLRGRDQPADADEAAAFAQLCAARHLDATAARLWSEAFAAEPGLADDPMAEARYQAARAAALAGTGRGRDRPPPDEAARARWRRQALDWLAAELAAIDRRLEEGTSRRRVEILRGLGRWRVDPALAGLRDEAAIAALPEAERPAIRALWCGSRGPPRAGKKEGPRHRLGPSEAVKSSIPDHGCRIPNGIRSRDSGVSESGIRDPESSVRSLHTLSGQQLVEPFEPLGQSFGRGNPEVADLPGVHAE